MSREKNPSIKILQSKCGDQNWQDDLNWLSQCYAEAITEELKGSWLEEHRKIDPEKSGEIRQMLEFALQDEDRMFLLLAYHNEKRIGYFVGLVKTCVGEAPQEIAYINGIYLYPEYRSQGIGKSLLSEALQRFRAKGLTLVELYVGSHLESSKAFWKKHGFQITEEVYIKTID